MSKFLITSALPYVNGVKHLGNLAGSLLPADIHARFRRQTGHEVLFLCGTDEHGTPVELAAQAAGVPVADYCARQHAVQADIYRRFGLSFDHFSRTSGEANRRLTQEIFRCLDAAGFIEERTILPGLLADRRALPARSLCRRHLPALRQCQRAGRPVRELHHAARPRRPALAALGDLGRDRHRVPRDAPSVPQALGLRRPAARLARDPTRLAAARPLDRAEMARRGPARPLHHARPRMGRAGAQGRASRTRSSMSGSTRRSATSPRRSSGARRRRGATGATGGRAADDVQLRAVPRQGQRAVPRRQLPGDVAGLGPAVQAAWTSSRASTG